MPHGPLPAAPPGFDRTLRFGRFALEPARKQLLADGRAVRLGGRALDLLIALVERAGEVVSHDELFARVWPRTVVEESSLRVHVSALRRALGESADARYIASIPGRGYRFVMDVAEAVPAPRGGRAPSTLPSRLTAAVGRDDVLEELSAKLRRGRLVTLVGPGGIGKTTVALAFAEAQAPGRADGALFVDLAPLGDPVLVPGALAAALGVPASAQDPWPALEAALAARELLIVLDNCEHVIAAAATLAERLLRCAPGVQLVATSREPLDAESEAVLRLGSLAMPPATLEPTVDEALGYPALRLFVERATASADAFVLSPANLASVVQLCRHLDGVPLAIELAAAHVGSLGIQALAERLDDAFRLLRRGRRTALPRHRTLQALLDWSHGLLEDDECRVLRRLAVFRSSFPLDAAADVAQCERVTRQRAVDCVLGLVSKSLVEREAGTPPRYRLLFVTRLYAGERLEQSGERHAVSRRHAACLCRLLSRATEEIRSGTLAMADWLATYAVAMPDVRAALDWSKEPGGDRLLCAELVVEASRLALGIGLYDELIQRAQDALAAVRTVPGDSEQLELHLLGILCMAAGSTDRDAPPGTAAQLEALAQRIGTPMQRRAALQSLCIDAFGRAEYARLAVLVERFRTLPPTPADPEDVEGTVIRQRFGALAAHYLGDHGAASAYVAGVPGQAGEPWRGRHFPQLPVRITMGVLQARILWLQGRADAALEQAFDSLAAAEAAHPFGVSQVLAMAVIPILAWRGEDERAVTSLERLARHVLRHGQSFWLPWIHGLCRALALRGRDTADIGAHLPAPASQSAAAADLLATLAEDLCGDDQLARVEAGTVGWCAPEVLRIHGERLLADAGRRSQGESVLQRALALARRQGARAWELRVATGIAAHWQAAGYRDAARELLAGCVAGFTEGRDGADLRRAQALLAAWAGPGA